jgi:hypothetical protein
METLDNTRTPTVGVLAGGTPLSGTAPPALPELQGTSGSEPTTQFTHPCAVLEAGALTGRNKRALLATWASDAYAVEGRPALRWLPGTPEPVAVDDILSCLQALDREGLH